MRILSDGKVGIGTSSPNSKMTVQGDLDIPVNSRFRAGSGDSNHTGVDIYHDGSNNYTLIENRPSGGDLIFRQMHNGKDYIFKADNDSGTEQEIMRIDGSNARVGIGTTTPSQKLDVNGNVQIGDGGTGGSLRFNTTDRGVFTVNGSEIMRLKSNGRVGIGTTSPAELFNVESASNTLALFKSTDNRGLIQVADDDTTASIVAENSTLSLGLTSQISASNINIDSSGKLGIGTTSPSAKLDVRDGNTANVALISGATNGNMPVLHVIDSSDQWSAWFEGRRIGDPGTGIRLYHNPSSVATNNNTYVQFSMNDAAGARHNYAMIKGGIDANTAGAEDGHLAFQTSKAASLTEAMRITSRWICRYRHNCTFLPITR